KLEARLSQLHSERDSITSDINGLITDAAPIALAEDFCRRTKEQIEQDLHLQGLLQERRVHNEYRTHLEDALVSKLAPDSLAIVLAEMDKLGNSHQDVESQTLVHDLTPAQAGKIHSTFEDASRQRQDLIR